MLLVYRIYHISQNVRDLVSLQPGFHYWKKKFCHSALNQWLKRSVTLKYNNFFTQETEETDVYYSIEKTKAIIIELSKVPQTLQQCVRVHMRMCIKLVLYEHREIQQTTGPQSSACQPPIIAPRLPINPPSMRGEVRLCLHRKWRREMTCSHSLNQLAPCNIRQILVI